jgi:hypothetical protein
MVEELIQFGLPHKLEDFPCPLTPVDQAEDQSSFVPQIAERSEWL